MRGEAGLPRRVNPIGWGAGRGLERSGIKAFMSRGHADQLFFLFGIALGTCPKVQLSPRRKSSLLHKNSTRRLFTTQSECTRRLFTTQVCV